MLKEKIEDALKGSIQKAIENKELGELAAVPDSVLIENPKSADHGDRSVGMAMSLAKEAKLPPRKIAETIVKNLPKSFFTKVDIAGPGFINLTLDWQILEDSIKEIHQKDTDYGKSCADERLDKNYENVLLEYVSANPTGDLHIGHGRQAVIGSALASLLNWAGYKVQSEFYINDAGVQIQKLARSAQLAMQISEGKLTEKDYPEEDVYPLDSMLDFLTLEEFIKAAQDLGHKNVSSIDDIELDDIGVIAKNKFLKVQEELLSEIRTNFDEWYSEKRLHEASREAHSKVEDALAALEKAAAVYEADGAKWFKAKEYGDERDRVLVKSNGLYTYLIADVAYHKDKSARKFDKLINVWGADHHGQEPGLKGALQAIGEPADKLEVVYIQMVSLKAGDAAVKMSKRTGNLITVRDVVAEVGVDAFRYFLVESQANNHMVFDLELAKKQDKDNPVYYIQYAHARSCSILRTLTGEQINIEDKQLEEPVLSSEELDTFLKEFKTDTALFAAFEGLGPKELSSTKALILHLSNFSQEIQDAAQKRSPYRIAMYLKDLATLFHQFYTNNRVIVEDKNLLKARLSLIVATQKVIRNGLTILGISAPERM